MKKLGVIIGSLRKDSFTRKVAEYMADQLKSDFDVEIIDIGALPMYNQDFDENPPQEWVEFRKKVADKDAYLFASPEYNRSMPAAIKNALDVASRPMGENVWAKKPAALVTVSPGAMGGFGSNHHLRQTMSFLDIYVMNQPEAYIGEIHNALDDSGKLTSERTLSFLQKIGNEFVAWSKNFN